MEGKKPKCPICYGSLKFEPIILGCRHTFCNRCIHHWCYQCCERFKKPKCPLCRRRIKKAVTICWHSWCRKEVPLGKPLMDHLEYCQKWKLRKDFCKEISFLCWRIFRFLFL